MTAPDHPCPTCGRAMTERHAFVPGGAVPAYFFCPDCDNGELFPVSPLAFVPYPFPILFAPESIRARLAKDCAMFPSNENVSTFSSISRSFAPVASMNPLFTESFSDASSATG